VTPEQLADKLRRNERSFRTRWLTLIALGAMVTMILPLLISSLMWITQFSSRRGGPPETWMFITFKVCAVALPVLLLLEWLTRGKLMEKTAETVGGMGPVVPRVVPGVGRGIAIVAFIEMGLWGPRMVIAGTRRIFGISKQAGADRALAAKMLHALLVRGEGLPTAQLYPLANGRDDAFGDALGYLLFFDLIGISKAGDRAWMLGDAKRTLKLESN
jgi:hypothetical protein